MLYVNFYLNFVDPGGHNWNFNTILNAGGKHCGGDLS